MNDLIAVRDELVDLYLKPRRRGSVRLAAAAPRSPRARSIMMLAVESGRGAPFLEAEPIESRVHAIGIGSKSREGEPAVIVYVTRRLEKDQLPPAAIVPEKIQGVPTAVVESRIARLAALPVRQSRVRPLVAGVSISRSGGRSGTLGAFVQSTRSTDSKTAVLLLSNSHVLAPETGRAAGTAVVQASTDDGESETVATVLRASRLHRTVPITVDAAVAQIAPGIDVNNVVLEIGPVKGTRDPVENMRVEKHGRTSGHTVGRIAATGLTAQVEDEERGIELTFEDLFRVEQLDRDDPAVGEGGDSGSLVIDAASRDAVGLLHAADDLGSFYYAHPIAHVLKEMEIELKLG